VLLLLLLPGGRAVGDAIEVKQEARCGMTGCGGNEEEAAPMMNDR